MCASFSVYAQSNVCVTGSPGAFHVLRGHISGPVVWKCRKASVLGSLCCFHVNFPLSAVTHFYSRDTVTHIIPLHRKSN